jgi:ferritin
MVCQLVSVYVFLSKKRRFFRYGQLDAETIYFLLEHNILPLYYERKESAKEVGHACTIAEYMVKREATPKVDKVDVVPQGWGNSLEVFEHALEHEKHISKLIDELVYLASEEKDNATQDFLWKFVREQIEEEAGVQNIVNLLKKAGDSGILFIDAKLDGCK